MVSERIKKIIFNKLYKDLGHVEIIDYNNDVWFIDRENKFWFLELKKSVFHSIEYQLQVL